MATITQVPGELDIVITAGDDVSIDLDFDIALTGYTFAALVVTDNETPTTVAMLVTNTDLATGKLNLSLTDVQTAAIGTGEFCWYLTWTITASTLIRKVLRGKFSVV
jgi:hypothetical protein